MKTTKQQKSECFPRGRTDMELKGPETKLCKHSNYLQGKDQSMGKSFTNGARTTGYSHYLKTPPLTPL